MNSPKGETASCVAIAVVLQTNESESVEEQEQDRVLSLEQCNKNWKETQAREKPKRPTIVVKIAQMRSQQKWKGNQHRQINGTPQRECRRIGEVSKGDEQRRLEWWMVVGQRIETNVNFGSKLSLYSVLGSVVIQLVSQPSSQNGSGAVIDGEIRVSLSDELSRVPKDCSVDHHHPNQVKKNGGFEF